MNIEKGVFFLIGLFILANAAFSEDTIEANDSAINAKKLI